jgi:CBS domain-containing membrane protein
MRVFRVGEVMSAPVVSLTRGHSLHLAASLMELRHIRHLPVVDGKGRCVGLVTHRDLLAAQADLLAQSVAREEALWVPVARVMKAAVWTVQEDTAALEAAQIMIDHKFGCLPITRGQRLVGIVTEADLLGAFLSRTKARRGREDTEPRIPIEAVRR